MAIGFLTAFGVVGFVLVAFGVPGTAHPVFSAAALVGGVSLGLASRAGGAPR